MFDEIDALFV